MYKFKANADVFCFRLFGVQFNSKISMNAEIRARCVQAALRINALKRVKRFFNNLNIMQLSNCKLLSYIEAERRVLSRSAFDIRTV